MNFKNVLTILKKEINTILNNPVYYVVLIVFLIIWEFFYFNQVFLIGEASLRLLYSVLPWLMLVLASAITMGSIAKEKDEDTLELILTHPVRESEFVLGKFLSELFFVTLPLIFALPLAISISKYGHFDWGAFWGQFAGSILLAGALVSLGIFVSSLLLNQVASLLVTVVSGILLMLLGSDFLLMGVPLVTVFAFENLSILTHVNSISRGVLDTRDIWYFLSFILIFLGLTYVQLIKRKLGASKKYAKVSIGIYLVCIALVVSNIFGNYIPGRIDLTQGRSYTLSPVTLNTLANLNKDNVVTLTLYASSQLPAQYQPILRDAKDILKDYQENSKGHVIITIKDPSTNSNIGQEASSNGIQQVQFNVVGNEEFQVKTGFLGLLISAAGSKQAVPFIQSTSDLEYQITSNIKKLTDNSKKTVGFLTGHGEKDGIADYKILNSEISKQFTTKILTLDKDNPKIEDDIDVLIVAGPTLPVDQKTRDAIKAYLEKGKNAIFLIDSNAITATQNVIAVPNVNSFADFISGYGVNVDTNLVYDLKSSEQVQLSNGNLSYMTPYPYWIKAQPDVTNSQITAKIDSVSMPWVSSLSLDEAKLSAAGFKPTPLLTTTIFAGTSAGQSIDLNPGQSFSQTNLAKRLIAVALTSGDNSQTKGPLIIVVGDSKFLSDSYLQDAPQNMVFGMNAISWLGQEDSLGDIKIKANVFGNLNFNDPIQPEIIKYLNIGLVLILPAAYGFLRLTIRRTLKQRKF